MQPVSQNSLKKQNTPFILSKKKGTKRLPQGGSKANKADKKNNEENFNTKNTKSARVKKKKV